jgi:single-stranded-DNA-specific exonuclease
VTVVRKRWVLVESDPSVVRRLQDELSVGAVTATLLAARGFDDPAAVGVFFDPRLADLPHPHTMAGAEAAAKRVAEAIERGEPIVVHGDYDADGVTASAVLLDFFRAVDYPIDYYIPHRVDHGYGFSAEGVAELASGGCKLLITVDCGINDHAAVAAAAAAGIAVIVTDHHEIDGGLPDAVAVLNPHQPSCGFHDQGLAGVGVAFFLMAAIRIELAKRGNMAAATFDLKSVLDLVALGTVADIVPLVGVNRILVTHGLTMIDRGERPGIAALKKVAGVRSPVRSTDIGFRLAPRINAAGRMGDAGIGVDLLTTRDPVEARAIAEKLHEENTNRQTVELGIFTQAKQMYDKVAGRERLRSIVLAHAGWHPGVIGIVASRMAEAYCRPTILISASGEVGQGSGRSIPDFNLHEAIGACAEMLEGYGGHAQAAGLQIRTERIMDFARCFDTFARGKLKPEDLTPRQRVDAWCDIDEINERMVEELDRLTPFGAGNPEPVLGARDVEVLNRQIVGRDHLKLRIPCRKGVLAVIAYGFGKLYDSIGSRVDLAFVPEFNYYGGVQHVQLRAKDIALPDAG